MGLARFSCFSCGASTEGESSDRNDGTQDVRADQTESQYVDTGPPVSFNLSELTDATNDFDEQRVLGKGRFGCVYKGTLKGGQEVAVKKHDYSQQAAFRTEVQMLSYLKHANLVKLIGYHEEGSNLFTVYEFMPSKSLNLHLHEHKINKEPLDWEPLDWETRMKIAEGVAKALQYLHDQNHPPVIYGDLKTSGILLDAKLNPKLSDFSLAKIGPTCDLEGDPIKLRPTIGYNSPEFVMTDMLSRSHDIYSFGVVLLQLITGRKAMQKNLPGYDYLIRHWARPFLDREKFSQMADPLLKRRYPKDGLAQALRLAKMCVDDSPTKRPLIADVVTGLSGIVSQASRFKKEGKK